MSTIQPMLGYKSRITRQKIQDYKSKSIDRYDLDNIQDIEKKFQQFSESFQTKYFPETTASSQNDKKQTLMRKNALRFASQDTQTENTIKLQRQNTLAGILRKDTITINRNSKPNTAVNFDDSQNMTQTLTNTLQKKEQQPLNGLIDQKFKLMLQKNNQKENPVVSYFGNSLIATVFQSLIIKTLDEKFRIKINMDCDIPISTNVLKLFELSTVAINNIKGVQQKKEYIYNTMCNKIDSLIQTFDEKTEQREAIIKKQEKENKKKIKSDPNDQFQWLQLKASHETLRKKLKQQIVEKLSEYENLLLIESAISQKQELKNNGQHDQARRIQASLTNFKVTPSKEVFQNMSKYGSHKIQQFLSRLGITKYPDEKNPTQKINKQLSKRSNSEDQILTSPSETSQNINDIKGFKTQESCDQNKFWTIERENEFQNQRSKKKHIYSNEIVSSNWNDVGFLPFVQKYILEYKKSIHRDTLLNRYSNGEYLSEEELKFLANTSELLNSCVDKQYMQKAANTVNPDLLDNLKTDQRLIVFNKYLNNKTNQKIKKVLFQMELGLAEQILSNYEDARLEIKKARQEYIKEKQEKQQEWLSEQYEKARRQKIKIYNANFYRRYYKMFTGILDRMEKSKKFADKLPENIHGAEYLNDYLLGKTSEKESIQNIYKIGKLTEFEFKRYIDTKKQKAEEKIEQEKEGKRFNELSKPASYASDAFIKNIKRRKYHPSSKLFIDKNHSDPEEEEQKMKDLTIEQQEQIRYSKQKKKQIKQTEIEKYELNLKTIDLLREQSNFKNFYSGGPQKQLTQMTIFFIQSNYFKRKIKHQLCFSKQQFQCIQINIIQISNNISIFQLELIFSTITQYFQKFIFQTNYIKLYI